MLRIRRSTCGGAAALHQNLIVPSSDTITDTSNWPGARYGQRAGNYQSGALHEHVRDCDYNAQFEEKRCRTELRFDSMVCRGAVTLHYVNANPMLEVVCAQPLPDSLVFWSIGNHPIRRGEAPVLIHGYLAAYGGQVGQSIKGILVLEVRLKTGTGSACAFVCVA